MGIREEQDPAAFFLFALPPVYPCFYSSIRSLPHYLRCCPGNLLLLHCYAFLMFVWRAGLLVLTLCDLCFV
ncbi:hypothetical protein F5X96DRAFT_622527 [Biscogniauxia mediterranea]|nr:hypothetical protein F5X96DRAFT_622527 [Biscogniauxia mediterranea]